VVIRDGLVDRDFVRDHVAGFALLEAAVAPFTPRFAEQRAGVPPRRSSAPRTCSAARARDVASRARVRTWRRAAT
jgi:anaerobic selenocysteine-containing dehydrogenase